MKSLPIKTWMVGIFLPLMIFGPLFLGMWTAFILEKAKTNDIALLNQQASENWQWLRKNIFDQPGDWGKEEWQKRVIPELQKRGMFIRIIHQNNQLVFQYPVNLPPTITTFHAYPTENGIVYLAENYKSVAQNRENQYILEIAPFFVWLTSILSIIFLAIRFLQRNLLKPLAYLYSATQLASSQNFSFQIPPTRISEMKGVLESFLHMNQSLEDAQQQQKNLENERKIFISSIAHDLRTPLFSIRGALQAIEKGIHPERNQRYIEICIKKADLMSKMIDELFLFSKLDQIKQPIHREYINLEQFLQEILEDLQWLAQNKNIRVELANHSNIQRIKGDQDLLHRAFSNILLNAFQYTPNDGFVMISINDELELIQITIRDTGPGIRKEDIPYIFLPFYRADHARNEKKGGSGLGLAIAEKIFSAHGGNIRVAQTSEQGTSFVIQLPKPDEKHD